MSCCHARLYLLYAVYYILCALRLARRQTGSARVAAAFRRLRVPAPGAGAGHWLLAGWCAAALLYALLRAIYPPHGPRPRPFPRKAKRPRGGRARPLAVPQAHPRSRARPPRAPWGAGNKTQSQRRPAGSTGLVGMCANKVATAYHLIGTIVRGYVAQSIGRIGLSNKNNSESHCQGEQELQLGF
jgi:hypothetical protein